MATLRSLVLAGSGSPISGAWHKRTCHPRSLVRSVMGETGRIWAAVPPWSSCAALTRSSSVASVWPDSDLDAASSRSSSSCPSGG
eukprot:1478168-Pleurochrysis_carterae.AAC.1